MKVHYLFIVKKNFYENEPKQFRFLWSVFFTEYEIVAVKVGSQDQNEIQKCFSVKQLFGQSSSKWKSIILIAL